MEKQEKTITPIFFEADLEQMFQFFNELNFSKLFILTDENTHKLCLPNLMDFLNEYQESIEILEIEAGEENKNLETASNLVEAMLELSADRQAVLVNLGGGVISDLGGFIASIYKRGIRFVNIPTSLLAMVDASIGGKTGVDSGFYKNQIGTFKHPEAIFVFADFLQTLPEREIKSGFAEIVKYCLLDDKAYFDAIENTDFTSIKQWNDLIQLSMTVKNEIVTDDPEETGIRKILNFGHTLGHAVESYSLKNHQNHISHGEAVAAGILMESWISMYQLDFSLDEFNRIRNFILRNFGKIEFTKQAVDEIFDFIKQDKKNIKDAIYPVLLKEMGKPEYKTQVSEDLVKKSLHYYIDL